MMPPEPLLITNDVLWIRKFSLNDAAFVLALVNDPDWLKNIGDRDVHDLSQARKFIENGPLSSYQEKGFGLYVFGTQNTPAGMVGLLQRDYLCKPDLGYAILPQFRNKGLTYQACALLLDFESRRMEIDSVYAMVSPDNHASVGVLKKLGFIEKQMIDNDGTNSRLFEVTSSSISQF